jgi:hypothetical protein
MTTNMRMRKFTKLMGRFWGQLRKYAPEEGYSHDPYEAEGQVRDAFRKISVESRTRKGKHDRRIDSLIKNGVSERLVDEAIRDEVSGRLVRIRKTGTRVTYVKNYFSSMLEWRNRRFRTVEVSRRVHSRHRRR